MPVTELPYLILREILMKDKKRDNSKKTAVKKIPELCVPAGNLNVLNYALAYGADAVYIGGSEFNLRTLGDNFSMDELAEGVKIAHSIGKKVYITLNAIISEFEIKPLIRYLEGIKKIEFDAVIISDPGLISLIREIMPETRIHISTQVSTSNHLAVNFWADLGADRVNLAREIYYEDLKKICLKSRIQTEVFVHGALCISYSGRCFLSKYLSGRDANKGKCAHTCRWKYYLMEEMRPNLFLQVSQDRRGTYIMNSRDLCLLDKLDLVVKTGVSSLKIEGRMKTEGYVSAVTWVYRKALDLISENKYSLHKKNYLLKELDKISHRTYTEGFMFSESRDNPELTENDNVGYIQKYKFTGSVTGYDEKLDGPIIVARNQLKVGDMLDILQPFKNPVKFKLKDLIDLRSRNAVQIANTNDEVIIPGLGKIDRYAIIKAKISV